MATVTNPTTQPLSSGEFEFTDPDRYEDVERKQGRIAEFLARKGYDALLIRQPHNFAWFTVGAECPRHAGTEPAAALFITPDARVVVADGRGAAYRHWNYGDLPLRRWCFVSATVSRWGLCCGVTRSVVFGSPTDDLLVAFQQAGMLEATGIFFSQAGWPLATVWQKVHRI